MVSFVLLADDTAVCLLTAWCRTDARGDDGGYIGCYGGTIMQPVQGQGQYMVQQPMQVRIFERGLVCIREK